MKSVVIFTLGVFALVGSVKAVPVGFWEMVAERVSAGLLVELGGSEILGGGTRFPNGISADSTSPSAGEVRGTTLTITSLATLSGGITGAGANTLLNPEYTSTVLATSTNTEVTGVLAHSDLVSYDMFSVSIGSASGMTYTLPASSTMTSELATAGDRKSWVFDNTTTTAGVDLKFAAGAGSYLLHTSSTASTARCFASSTCILTGIKKSNSDINWLFDMYAN